MVNLQMSDLLNYIVKHLMAPIDRFQRGTARQLPTPHAAEVGIA